ncbi:MAG: CHAT domain-containing protein [Rubripirellula sp.]
MSNYENFSIRIGSSESGVYPVTMDSPLGSCQSTFELPFLEQENIDVVLAGFAAKLRGTRDLIPLDLPDDAGAEVLAEELGNDLYDALFHGEAKSLLKDCLQSLSNRSGGLRIKIHLSVDSPSSAKLSQLPWELLRDSETQSCLNLSQRTPVVRYIDVPKPFSSLAFKPPFRVLVVISNPSDVAQLDLARERELIESNWGKRDGVHIEFLEKASTQELQQQLQQGVFHALHFMGHGDFDPESGRGVLVMENDNGTAQFISGRALGNLLADAPSLRFVFLNACKTAQSHATNSKEAFAGVSTALLMAGVPAVVAMQYPISDEAAIAFSKTFYRLLPACHPLEKVVAEARKSVFQLQESSGRSEWATPVLFMRTDDGRVFESIYRTAPLDPKQQALLARLTVKVRQFWIEGKLDKDIPIKPPIVLTKELSRKSVQREMDELNEHTDDDSEDDLVPAGKTIGSLYDESDRSLLILGDPGYGKSITLLALAHHLMLRHDSDPAEPVPVVLFLSTWSTSGLPIDRWIAKEIADKYKIPNQLAMEWLVDDRIVLMLDGLDEVIPSRRESCVLAINDFMKRQIDHDGRCCLAVCSRFEEYERLESRFAFETAIKLRPLSEQQIRDFLAKFGAEMSGLQKFLESDPQLLEDAQSPLMLGMMSIAYSLNPDEFADYAKCQHDSTSHESGVDRSQSRRGVLVDTYLNRVFGRKRAAKAAYSRDETVKGISWLARKMRRHHHNVFLIEDLQPTWLENPFQKGAYLALFSVFLGTLFGLVLTSVWFISNYVDPAPPGAQFTQIYWIVGCIPWVFCVGLLDRWRTVYYESRAIAGKKRLWTQNPFVSIATRTALFYLVWLMIWYPMALLFRAEAVPMKAWFSHPLQCGVTLSILYSVAVGGRAQDHYIGTTEQLKWSWYRSGVGLGVGAAIGVLRFVFYIIGHWGDGQGYGNLLFYVPMWMAAGALFGGFRLGMVDGKTQPNEGILLSLRNAGFAAAVIGIGMATVLLFVTRYKFGEPWDRAFFSALVLLNLFTVLGALFFGLVDAIRHYTLRLMLYLTGAAPLNMAKFYDHMDELVLLQKIGGGYIFRNHLLFDHFSQREVETPQKEGSD